MGYATFRFSKEINSVPLLQNLDRVKIRSEDSSTVLYEILKKWSIYGVSTNEVERGSLYEQKISFDPYDPLPHCTLSGWILF